MDALSSDEIKGTSSAFDHQTFKNWKMILPAENLDKDPSVSNNKITIIKNGKNKVHNIEKGVAR